MRINAALFIWHQLSFILICVYLRFHLQLQTIIPLTLMRELHDHYFQLAKREGYRSRAAYKLIEIDERKRIFRKGDRVLDCGAAPGSWLQVAARRTGPRGLVVGIDLQPIEQGFHEDNILVHQGDFYEFDSSQFTEMIAADGDSPVLFDVVISDMAPGTTGDHRGDHYRSAQLCEAVLDQLHALLRAGGNIVMKVFEGEQYPLLLGRVRNEFDKCKGFKPKASRSESVEMYIVAHGYRGRSTESADDGDDNVIAPPRRPRPRGW